MNEQYTKKQVKEAIQESGGIKSHAAAKLQCTRQTIERYCKKYPEVQKAYAEQREKLVDLGEAKMMQLVRNEEHPRHFNAVRFLLQTIGRERGWSEEHQLDHKYEDVGDALDIDLKKLSRKQLYMLREIIQVARGKKDEIVDPTEDDIEDAEILEEVKSPTSNGETDDE